MWRLPSFPKGQKRVVCHHPNWFEQEFKFQFTSSQNYFCSFPGHVNYLSPYPKLILLRFLSYTYLQSTTWRRQVGPGIQKEIQIQIQIQNLQSTTWRRRSASDRLGQAWTPSFIALMLIAATLANCICMLCLNSVIWKMNDDDRPHDHHHQGYLVLNQVLWGRQRVHTSSNSEPRSSNTYQNIRPALILTTGMISKKGLQVLQIFSL